MPTPPDPPCRLPQPPARAVPATLPLLPLLPESTRSLVFLFPHQDDEFAVMPVLDLARRRGWRVRCLFLTAGSRDGRAHPRRDAESRAVLTAFGVARADILPIGTRLGIPDGTLVRHLAAVLAAIADACRAAGPQAALLVPAWEGGHQDHDAAHLAGLAAAHSLAMIARMRQFSLYNGAGLPGPCFRVTAALAGNGPCATLAVARRERIAHLRLCLAYRSQWPVFAGLLPGLLRTLVCARPMVLQAVAPARVRQRPHPGALLYERRGRMRYADFHAAAAALLDRLPSWPA